MFRKSILSVTTVVLLSSAAAAVVPTSASAGSYGYGYSSGYGNGGGYGGYQYKKPRTYRSHNAYQGNNPHLRWCYNRYKSYREYDNTFQPYHGPRQLCLSPYEDERLVLFPENPAVAPDLLFNNEARAVDAPGQRDEFGNLPEGRPQPAPDANAAGSEGLRDEFGNLPESAPAAAPADAPRDGAPAAPAPVTSAPASEPQGDDVRTDATGLPAGEPQAATEAGQAEAQAPASAEAADVNEDLRQTPAAGDDQSG
jgi:hypothetical protein